MSNMKKTIPTLVGGAMLLTNVSALAVDEMVNTEEQNQEIGTSEVKNPEETIENVIEVVEDVKDEKIDEVVNQEAQIISNTENKTVEETTNQNTVTEEVAEVKEEVVNEESNIAGNARSTTQQKVMQVAKDEVAVREGSESTTNKVGTLKKDDYVDVYEQDAKAGWSKINYEGKMAYVNTSDLVDIAEAYKEATEDGVVVRSGAGDSYGEFGKLAKGDRVQVYQELSNGWTKINYNSKISFVETAKLKETYISKATVTVEKVNVYETASDTAKVLGECKKNETLYIYAEEGNYYKVKFSDSFGYVKKSDLKLITNTVKPQTGDAMVFSYMGAVGVSVLGLVSVNRKKND